MMRDDFIHRLLLPSAVGLIAVVLALTVLLRLLKQQRAVIDADTQAQAMFVKNKMESVLKARTLPLEILGRRWQIRQELNQVEMDSDAALVMSGYPTYQALEWVDPMFRVRWVAPHEENAADLDTDLTSDAARIAAILTSAETSRVTVGRPIDLRQGGRGFLVCVPVRSDSNEGGFVVGVFRYQDLLDSILQDVAQDYWVAVYDGDDQIYLRTGARRPQNTAPVEQEDIKFWQVTWRAQVWPTAGKLGYAQSILPQVTFVGGMLMAVWLAFTIYIAQTARMRSEKLEAEIASREQAEEALRHAQKMEAIGRLAGGVAHDFNNLLMVIRGQATLSLQSLFPTEALRRNLESILKAAERASSVSRQLLAFSRKQVLQPRVLDLNTLVRQVADLLPAMIG